MNVDYSKDFKKSVKKLSGKMLDSVRRVVEEVKNAESLKDITDCKKLVGYRNVYRIRIGDYRAFFTFHIEIINDTIIFRYLVPRGEAYDKKAQKELKRIDDCIHYKIILLSILPNHPYHQPLHTQSILMLFCRPFLA